MILPLCTCGSRLELEKTERYRIAGVLFVERDLKCPNCQEFYFRCLFPPSGGDLSPYLAPLTPKELGR
jgi:hypothetical protein